MRIHPKPFALALLLVAATPLHAKTIAVAAGEQAQQRLQEALILAQPGDVIEIGAGRFPLTDGLSLDVAGVTIKGTGMETTVLDFTGQQGAGEGLLVTSDDVTMRDFAIENPKGDGIKSKGADRVVYHRVRVAWTGAPKETNGAYGIYPVESTGVLIDGCKVRGASDAGIYVGQSRDITVRYSTVEISVAGIEIENSRNALVSGNFVTRNTGGILVFDLPNLPVMGGGNTLITGNLVVANDTPNFAPKGNIVASVPRGTGVMIMANDGVLIEGNTLADNATAQVMVVAYPNKFKDTRYNPFPRNVAVGANTIVGGGNAPQLPGGDQLAAAFGGAIPPVLWDGQGSLGVSKGTAALSLGLTVQGTGMEAAKPRLVKLAPSARAFNRKGVGAPAALELRIPR